MYRVLKGEMVKSNIGIRELAFKIGITERSLRNKKNRFSIYGTRRTF
mgnify:CR=1 FL=1